MPKVFISHSWEDNDIARKVAEYLKRDGTKTWIDYAKLSGGESLPEKIGEAIEESDVLVLLWSKSAKNSYFVKLEWTTALTIQKRVIPCMIDDTRIPTILAGFLYIPFKNFEHGYRDLARALQLEIKTKEKNSTQTDDVIILPKIKIFRSVPKELSNDQVKAMLKKYDFFDINWNKMGKGFPNQFELKIVRNKKVVIDHATGLMWQQTGSHDLMSYGDAGEYINQLNESKFAGFHNWRLPTLEEGISLMRSKKNKNGLYLDPIFGSEQWWIWTSDKVASESRAWIVDFYSGRYHDNSFDDLDFVRAVRPR